jgi:hypothetical protein
MATSKAGRKGLDEQPLEGGGSGGGASIKGTKWSSLPSLRGSSSTIDDLKKLGADTSKLKGSAKTAKEAAIDRAITRTVVRAGAASAAGAGAAAMTSESKPKNGSDNEFMGSVRADPKNPTGVEGTGMAKGGMVKKKMSAYNAVYMGKDKRK